jgi:peroxiredoxin
LLPKAIISELENEVIFYKASKESTMTMHVTTIQKRRYQHLVTIMMTMGILFSPLDAAAINVTAGDRAHDFTADNINGEKVSLSDYREKVVFVAFWSSWCSRCKEEMEYLKELRSRYPEIAFLAINAEAEDVQEEDVLRMQKAIKEWELPFTILIDRGLIIWDKYAINALPTSFIVGKDGNIVFAEANFYFGSAESIEKALGELGLTTGD